MSSIDFCENRDENSSAVEAEDDMENIQLTIMLKLEQLGVQLWKKPMG